MKDQLLDVTIVIAGVEESDEHPPFAITHIYRGDLEGEHLDSFIKAISLEPGIVHLDKISAKEVE